MSEETRKRHPFRFLFKLALFAGVVSALAKFAATRRQDFYGLTESEAKTKIEEKLTPRIGGAKAARVSEKVIPKLKERGIVKPDAPEKAVEEAEEAVAATPQPTEEAVEGEKGD